MQGLIKQFNQKLVAGTARCEKVGYAGIVGLEKALSDLGLSDKCRPLNLKHLLQTEVSTPSALVSEPDTTIEFRFPQAARSGDEARFWNELLCAWMLKMERDQRENKPLQTEFNNPMDYKDDQEVLKLFKEFAEELGLEWSQARLLSHISHIEEDGQRGYEPWFCTIL